MSPSIQRVFLVGLLVSLLAECSYGANPGIYGRRSKAIDNFRFGIGVGYSLYLTNQMDYQITTNYGNFKELRPAFYAGFYQALSADFEIGVNVRNASMLTLKSANTQGSECDYTDFMLVGQYSLNHNVNFRRSRFTPNIQVGVGAVNFSSRYFSVDPNTKGIRNVIAALGYGSDPEFAIKLEPQRKTVMIGNLGVSLGYQLLRNVSVYYEASVTMSATNKMSGNLFKRSLLPPDSYFFTGIAVFFNFRGDLGKLHCPKL